VALLAEDKIVFGVDLREYPAVGELVGLRVPGQFEIHQFVEIGAAGHVGFILSHPRLARCPRAISSLSRAGHKADSPHDRRIFELWRILELLNVLHHRDQDRRVLGQVFVGREQLVEFDQSPDGSSASPYWHRAMFGRPNWPLPGRSQGISTGRPRMAPRWSGDATKTASWQGTRGEDPRPVDGRGVFALHKIADFVGLLVSLG
jgi:hypothetical protein